MGVVAGRVMPIPKGPYDAAAIYYILDMVTLNNKLWIAKQSNFSNHEPTATDEYWMLAVDGTTDVKALEAEITEKFTEYDGKFTTIEEQLAATLISVDESLASMEQTVDNKLATYAKGEGLEFGVTEAGILTVTYDDGQ